MLTLETKSLGWPTKLYKINVRQHERFLKKSLEALSRKKAGPYKINAESLEKNEENLCCGVVLFFQLHKCSVCKKFAHQLSQRCHPPISRKAKTGAIPHVAHPISCQSTKGATSRYTIKKRLVSLQDAENMLRSKKIWWDWSKWNSKNHRRAWILTDLRPLCLTIQKCQPQQWALQVDYHELTGVDMMHWIFQYSSKDTTQLEGVRPAKVKRQRGFLNSFTPPGSSVVSHAGVQHESKQLIVKLWAHRRV